MRWLSDSNAAQGGCQEARAAGYTQGTHSSLSTSYTCSLALTADFCNDLCNWFVLAIKKGRAWVNDIRGLDAYMEYRIIDSGYW